MTNLDEYRFYASIISGQAFVFKSLIDLLATNVRNDGYFKFTKDGIHISSNDSRITILIVGDFARENFNIYKCEEDMNIGTNLPSLQGAIRTVKRKERMALFIRKDNPEHLGIEIRPLKSESMEHHKSQLFNIKFYDVKKTEYGVPSVTDTYHHPIVLKSTNYQSVCKTLNIISRHTRITIKDSRFIGFYADGDKLINANLKFGDENSQPESPDIDDSKVYEKEFETSKLNGIIKLANMTNQIQIYAPKNEVYPLRFKIQAGTLGPVEIFLKDRKAERDVQHPSQEVAPIDIKTYKKSNNLSNRIKKK